MKEEQRLLKRWTLDLANDLIDEGWPRKYAFKQAHLCRRLLQYLGMGKVEFEYYKKDGTIRRARGTLCKDVSKDFDHYECRFPKEIDHLNGIKTDNRIENLREVNRSENELNKPRRWKKNPDSGLPGIHKTSRAFETWFRSRLLYSSIPEMLFFHLTLLGRRYY